MSFDVILPFLRPIAHFIEDPDVSEIMVNGGGRVFIERQGRLEEAEGVQLAEKNLLVAVRNIASRRGDATVQSRRHDVDHPKVPQPFLYSRRIGTNRNAPS
jgi:Flp pilus assembly CpaF family ATPase